MPIELPEEIVYFYEVTAIRDRLLYCIPPNELGKLVSKNQASKNILTDYPDGVDLKVSPVNFEEFLKQYDLKLGIDPDEIWRAFLYLKVNSKKPFPKTGFIRKSFLEQLAREVSDQVVESEKVAPPDRKKAGEFKKQKRFLKKQQSAQENLTRQLKRIKAERFDPKISIREQSFSRVKMTKGEKAFQVFTKLQRKFERGK